MRLSSLLLCAISVTCIQCSGCRREMQPQASAAPRLMIQYGCPACHVIPGVPGAVGKVGPSLASFPQQSYIAGVLPNTRENLERWLMHPQQVRPGTAMPEMGVTPDDARRISAFLQSE